MLIKEFREIFFGETYEWELASSKEETLTRLKRLPQLDGYRQGSLMKPGFIFYLRGNRFGLFHIKSNPEKKRSTDPSQGLYGAVYGDRNGSRIVARFRLPTVMFVFMTLYLGFPFLGSCMAVLIGGDAIWNDKVPSSNLIQFCLMVFIIFLGPFLFLRFVQFLRRRSALHNEAAVLNLMIKEFGSPRRSEQSQGEGR